MQGDCQDYHRDASHHPFHRRLPLASYGFRRKLVVNEASEEPPAHRVYLPGSTTHRRSAFQTASWFCGIRNTTDCVSRGLRWIRENPLRERLGVSTLLTSSRT